MVSKNVQNKEMGLIIACSKVIVVSVCACRQWLHSSCPPRWPCCVLHCHFMCVRVCGMLCTAAFTMAVWVQLLGEVRDVAGVVVVAEVVECGEVALSQHQESSSMLS